MSDSFCNTPSAFARGFTFVALVHCAFDVAAQSAEPVLAPVVVTAARVEQSQADALPHTTVITREMIVNSQADDLPTLLRSEAGVQFAQSGGPGELGSLFMRGANPSETLILVDGMPVRRQGFSSSAALEQILPEQIDHIEIVRGNVSAIYGSGAIGGVIQIFTKHGAQKPVLDASLEAGSRGTYKISGDIAGQLDATRYALAVTRFKTDGIQAMNAKQFPLENPDRDGNENTSVSGTVSHQLSKEHEIGVRLYANDARFSYDGGGFGGPTDINKGTSRQQSLALFSRDQFSPAWWSTLTLSQSRIKNYDVSISAFPYAVSYESSANLLQWANEMVLTPAWTLTAGVDLGRERADGLSDDGFSVTRSTPSRSTASEYAGVVGKFEAHQVQFNIRHDRIDADSKSTGYLGYGYAVTPKFKLSASVSTAFNAPTLAQVNDPANGNPALQPETARSYEIGAQYTGSAALLRATAFNTRTRNQFSIDPDNCFSGAFPAGCPTFNLAQASNRGVELSASGTVASTEVRASLTLQRPVNDLTEQLLPRRSRSMASVGLAQRFGGLRLGGDVRYSGKLEDGSQTLGTYWLANVNARYVVTKSMALFGRIDNVFDRDYQTVYGYNQPPRGVFVGLNWHQ